MSKEPHNQTFRQCQRVKFTFQFQQNSPNGEVLRWLLHLEGRSLAKDRALDAVRAFWLPLAYHDAQRYSQQELEDVAQLAIWRLEEQIRYLRSRFDLQSTEAVSSPPEPLHPVKTVPSNPDNMVFSYSSSLAAPCGSGETFQLLSLEEYDWSIHKSEPQEAS